MQLREQRVSSHSLGSHLYKKEKEIPMDEKLEKGRIALESLRKAKDMLSLSSNWNLLGIYGGNCLTFQRIENAKRALEKTINDMDSFLEELRDQKEDLKEVEELDTSIDNISLSLCDETFQERVKDIQEELNTATKITESILSKLGL